MRHRLLPAIIVLLLSQLASAAAFTSKASGNWSASGQTTWVEVGVPGNGDTVTISHAVTVDTNTTVGTSPSDTTTMAITVSSGTTLTVGAGVTLKVRGNLTSSGNGGGVVLSAGAIWEWDASQAVTPATKYLGNMGSGFVGVGVLTCNGSSGSPCVVRSNASGGNGRFTSTNSYYAITATYTTFLRLGDSAATGIGGAVGSATLSNTTFNACGLIDLSDTSGYKALTDCAWTSSVPATDGGLGVPICAKIRSSNSAGTKHVTRCSFDTYAQVGGNGMTYTDNYFGECPFVGFSSSDWAAWVGGLINYSSALDTFAPIGGMTDVYNLADNVAPGQVGNQHYISANSPGCTYDGLVFEYPHAFAIDGADPLHGNLGPATVTRCLVIPSATDGKASGNNLVNPSQTSGNTYDIAVTHNTIVGVGAQLIINESAPTGVDFNDVKSNLISSPGSTGDERAAVIRDGTASPPTFVDNLPPASATNNYLYNYLPYTHPVTGRTHDGFMCRLSASPTGNILDNTTGPQFVDDTRNAPSFAVHKGWAASGDTLRQKLDAFHAGIAANPALARSEFTPWVRAGFVPTNAALRTAAHDGTVIGAVQDAPPPSGPSIPVLMNHYRQRRAALDVPSTLRPAA